REAAALETKRAAAKDQVRIDVGFWGGAVPGNAPEFAALMAAGVPGFKGFLADSGVPEFPALGENDLAAALRAAAALDTVLLVHAEHPEELARAATSGATSAPNASDRTHRSYRDYL